jgi:hypothetical protein
VITAVESDYAASAAVGARDLDRVFDGFGAGGDEYRFFTARSGRQLVQFLGQANHAIVGCYHDAGMTELFELLLHRRGYFRVTMTGRTNRYAGAEIDISIAFDVPDLGTERAFGVNRCNVALAASHGGFFTCLPVLVGNSGKLGRF